MLKPPLMIMSFERPSSVRNPSASKRPRSPWRMKTVALLVEPLGGTGGVGAAVIAGHHHARASDDFADFALSHFAPVLVDQTQVSARGGLADGVELVRKRVGEQHTGAAAFGHAVDLDQQTWPTPDDVGLQLGCKRCARAGLQAEARQVEAIEVWQRHDALVLHRHEHDVRRALALGHLQELDARRTC